MRQDALLDAPPHTDAGAASGRQVLGDAVCALRWHEIRPKDAPVLRVARSTPPVAWSSTLALRVWWLLTNVYRWQLERAGWDVDLLPRPSTAASPPHAALASHPHRRRPSTAEVVEVALHSEGQVAITIPPGHPLHRRIRALEGARWCDRQRVWLVPVSYGNAVELRSVLTGLRTRITPEAVQRLRHAANSPTPTGGVEDAGELPPLDYDGTLDGLRGVPVSELRAVQSRPGRGKAPGLAERLAKIGVHSVFDLLMLIPRRYLPRGGSTPLAFLPVGQEVGLVATVTQVGSYDRVRRLVRVTVTDGSDHLVITFFNSPWIPHRFQVGDEVAIYGRLEEWSNGRRRVLQMTNPIMDRVGDNTALIVPIYHQSEKHQITTWDLHSAAMEAVRRLGNLHDPLPVEVRAAHRLLDRREALRQVHCPDSVEAAEQGRRRLAFDELLRMQLVLGMRRHAAARDTGIAHTPTGVLTERLVQRLPFGLTRAQQRVIGEITEDLRRPHPMQRLLQGDVGSGKTVVAALALLSVVEAGSQGALMAPTEILADQLHRELAGWLDGLTHPDGRPVTVEFLANKTRPKQRQRILAGLVDGSVDIVVGTHALLGKEVSFARLGLVVVDEQHRFGVEQRAMLRAKGRSGTPDMLVMTATPIPRTAALTVYGDLEVSVLDELPPGRTPIRTTWLDHTPGFADPEESPWDLVRAEATKGRQAYVVASLIDDNEAIAAQSACDAYEALQAGALAGLRCGLVHGRQPRAEREATMAAFTAGELDVLVATTVIEVGVNVPNATVMVVLDAPRFGIAQLHQIRGRVGRGQHASMCILTGEATTGEATERMRALCASTDGFWLAEQDLRLRGEGSIFGTRQSGHSDLRVANLREDRELVAVCRRQAEALLRDDPQLARRPGLRSEVQTALGDAMVAWLDKA